MGFRLQAPGVAHTPNRCAQASRPRCGVNGPCFPGVSRSIGCKSLITVPGIGTRSPQSSKKQILRAQPCWRGLLDVSCLFRLQIEFPSCWHLWPCPCVCWAECITGIRAPDLRQGDRS